MEAITIKLKELLNHCNEWTNEVTFVEVMIDTENKTLEINGVDAGGLIMSDLDPIKEATEED